MPKRGRKRKKTHTHAANAENVAGTLTNSDEAFKVPKSLIIRRGKCEVVVADLVHDLRRLMMPFTAMNFHEDANFRKLTLNKYCQHVCLPLGISHILAFSQNEERLSLRIAKTPQGPTLTFRVHLFSLTKHIQKLQRRPINIKTLLDHSPIVVTNNFGDQTAPPQVKLMRITFQNMFPAINVATVKLKECRRVVLFHLVEEPDDVGNEGTERKTKQRIEMRHYAIKATPVGVNRKVRRLIQSKIPNLNKVQDIADYIAGNATATTSVDAASDSEPEDASAVVELAQNYAGKGNKSHGKSSLKLVELGPRLSLELIKVEQGLGDGTVMYHAHIQKTPEEAKAIQEKAENKIRLKEQRRREQEQNVERKRKAKEEKQLAKKKRKEEREEAAMDDLRKGGGKEDENVEDEDLLEDDDDVDEDEDSVDDASIEDEDDDDEH
ncbi:Brix domain containing protein [Nitzschia inconspicua]|uniref:Brix domain containing protein n=1 Tax=Nitzschia inconspicua TaxID=303405 RepID=A0A9K3PBM0_9STRA|nr:Brix domain containing protein [Nitzschia inconspicua]